MIWPRLPKNSSVHATVLDFSKAFDKAPHKRLITKLQYYGIRGPLLSRFETFKTNRSQTVVCDGKSSRPTQVTSGAPALNNVGFEMVQAASSIPGKASKVLGMMKRNL